MTEKKVWSYLNVLNIFNLIKSCKFLTFLQGFYTSKKIVTRISTLLIDLDLSVLIYFYSVSPRSKGVRDMEIPEYDPCTGNERTDHKDSKLTH